MGNGNCRNEKPGSRRNTINGGRHQEEEQRARKNHGAAGVQKVTAVPTAAGQACRVSNSKWTSGCSCVHCGGHREPKLIREGQTGHFHSKRSVYLEITFSLFCVFFLFFPNPCFKDYSCFEVHLYSLVLKYLNKIFIYLYFVDYLQETQHIIT